MFCKGNMNSFIMCYLENDNKKSAHVVFGAYVISLTSLDLRLTESTGMVGQTYTQ